MTKLTAKQELYVQGLVTGLSQRKAYREAYPSSQKWKDSTVDSKASHLLKEDKVSARYSELMNEHKEKAMWTREESVNVLKWLLEQSVESIKAQDEGYVRQGTSNAIISAIKELNELNLLYPMQQKQHEKLQTEIGGAEEQDDKITGYINKLKDVISDE